METIEKLAAVAQEHGGYGRSLFADGNPSKKSANVAIIIKHLYLITSNDLLTVLLTLDQFFQEVVACAITFFISKLQRRHEKRDEERITLK
ncbi:MAG: hypothetical protein HY966_07535 [Ignavibacteriales bacterium]|nr:hypothetical protein [Ignavibacteriales bacterium]